MRTLLGPSARIGKPMCEMQWEDMTDTMACKLLYGCERSGACEINFGADEKLTPP